MLFLPSSRVWKRNGRQRRLQRNATSKLRSRELFSQITKSVSNQDWADYVQLVIDLREVFVAEITKIRQCHSLTAALNQHRVRYANIDKHASRVEGDNKSLFLQLWLILGSNKSCNQRLSALSSLLLLQVTHNRNRSCQRISTLSVVDCQWTSSSCRY